MERILKYLTIAPILITFWLALTAVLIIAVAKNFSFFSF